MLLSVDVTHPSLGKTCIELTAVPEGTTPKGVRVVGKAGLTTGARALHVSRRLSHDEASGVNMPSYSGNLYTVIFDQPVTK